jgi:hypothetical protein
MANVATTVNSLFEYRNSGDIAVSTNSGSSWATTSTGMSASNDPAVFKTFNGVWLLLAGVSGGSIYYYSKNYGITWTASSTGIGGAKNVGIGSTTLIATKPNQTASTARKTTDGITWSDVTLPAARQWNEIVGSGSNFYCFDINRNFFIASSDNGANWTSYSVLAGDVANLGTASDLTDMIVTGGRLLVKAHLNTFMYSLTSTPNTWVTKTIHASKNFHLLAYNGTKLLTLGGVRPSVTLSSDLAYSLDLGDTWTVVAGGLPYTDDWTNLIWDGTAFYATSTGGKIIRSVDGTTWTTQFTKGTSWGALTSLTYTSNDNTVSPATSSSTVSITKNLNVKILLAVASTTMTVLKGISTVKIAISSSISTFFGYDTTFRKTVTAIAASISNIGKNKLWGNAWSFVYAFSKFIGVKTGTAVSATSTTGAAWITGALPSSKLWAALATDGTNLVTVAKKSNQAASSTDGSTWTARTLPSTRIWSALTCQGTNFVAVAIESDQCAVSSNGGVTWTEYSMPAKANWTSVATDGTIVVAISDSSVAASSTDGGQTWTQRAMPANFHYNCVTWANSQFTAVASGPTNHAAKSTNGTTWTALTMPSTADWTNVGPGVGDPNV